jgi:hypothetical protein
MKYSTYSTPLTERNFVPKDAVLPTMSAADYGSVMFQDPMTSQPSPLRSSASIAGRITNKSGATLTGDEGWRVERVLLHDWSNLSVVTLPEERSISTMVFSGLLHDWSNLSVVTLPEERSISTMVFSALDAANPVGVSLWPVTRSYTSRNDRPNWFTTNLAELPNSGVRSVSFSITPAFSSKYLSHQQLFDAVRILRLSNSERACRIADRLTALYQDAMAEGQNLLQDSIKQFAEFFLTHLDLGVPKITLTPDGTLRARWIHGQNNFAAIEFTGKQIIRFVAEIPRAGGLTARYFSSEPIDSILPAAIALGSSFS